MSNRQIREFVNSKIKEGKLLGCQVDKSVIEITYKETKLKLGLLTFYAVVRTDVEGQNVVLTVLTDRMDLPALESC